MMVGLIRSKNYLFWVLSVWTVGLDGLHFDIQISAFRTQKWMEKKHAAGKTNMSAVEVHLGNGFEFKDSVRKTNMLEKLLIFVVFVRSFGEEV